MMLSSTRVLVAIALVSALRSASVSAQAVFPPPPAQTRGAVGALVQVLTAAPIYVLPDATRQPLRVAKEGSVLRVAQDATPAAGWTYVQFADPDYDRRFGYIQTKFLQVMAAPLPEAIDLSVPESRPRPSVPRASPLRSHGKRRLPRRHRRFGRARSVRSARGSISMRCDLTPSTDPCSP